MREIKFRGRGVFVFDATRPDWYYGYLLRKRDGRFTIRTRDDEREFYIDPATVGQVTGLKDADGREIYEGDVIRSVMLPHMRTDVCNGCVEYRNGAFYVEYVDHTYANLGDLIFYSGTSSTVIGNIHDNPDLLEKQP